ncbi:hypothetical protein JW899_05060 [Candidatus Uhrbacteria bacterium]|nr:hypothetical protein [Candidatus Uhrbacteria bacterium]
MGLPVRLVAVAVVAGFLAVSFGAFVSAWPAPFGRLDVGLILSCGLVAMFRPTEAMVSAVSAGLALDAIGASVPGLHLLTGLMAVFLADTVFRRFLANLSWPSFVTLNALAFVFREAAVGAVSAVGIRLSGFVPAVSVGEWFGGLLSASAVQAAVALLLLGAFRSLSAWFNRRYLYSRNVH